MCLRRARLCRQLHAAAPVTPRRPALTSPQIGALPGKQQPRAALGNAGTDLAMSTNVHVLTLEPRPHSFIRATSLLVLLGSGCGNEPWAAPEPAQTAEVNQGPPTYYDDIEPLFRKSCTPCHQARGIAPFSLDDYAGARAHAREAVAAAKDRTMPPWLATADGSCGTFLGSLALGEQEIARMESWLDDGLLEGNARSLVASPVSGLDGAVELETPEFAPVGAGTDLTEADEYRCFMFDPGVRAPAFVKGFEVRPGTPSIVHHVMGMLVDPAAQAASGTETNLERIEALAATSPDRAGWPCYSMAGDGVRIEGFPVVWAPGQPVIAYPQDSGVPIASRHRLVVQVHYNLANRPAPSVTDQTTIRLKLADRASRLGGFVIVDPLLESLATGKPSLLAPGESSLEVSWERSASELGVGGIPGLELAGAMAHMHGRARRYALTLGSAPSASCALDIPAWDVHWQRLYFYAKPTSIGPATRFGATCEYDTSSDTEPVSPGWGAANEMCATILYFTAPNARFP
jgi:hypothetical protein